MAHRSPLPGAGLVGAPGQGTEGDGDGDIARTVVREPGASSPEQYASRVHKLAATYLCLFIGSLVGSILVITQGQFFVTLTQRSNIETLALAFAVLLFGYIAVISARGAWGAVRIFWWLGLGATSGDRLDIERRKMRALGSQAGSYSSVALNVLVEREGRPGDAIEFRIADNAGSLGSLVLDGARATLVPATRGLSNNVFAFLHHQVNRMLEERGMLPQVEVVAWKTVDDEATEEYLALVQFARNLEAHLGASRLWPKIELTDAECAELEALLTVMCPAMREEAFLPDWEYSAEHKLPIIPEPLGFVTLSRTERRVDPLASMGCAALVVVGLVALLVLFLLFPPWVPAA